jgi:hypothetical protein
VTLGILAETPCETSKPFAAVDMEQSFLVFGEQYLSTIFGIYRTYSRSMETPILIPTF